MQHVTVPKISGHVEIQRLDKDLEVIDPNVGGENGPNLILNNFREWLPRLLVPQIITSRPDNSPGLDSWMNRRIALIGFGVGSGGPIPSVKPESPEDGRSELVQELDYPNSKLGLQAPMRRIPLIPGSPSEINGPGVSEIPAFFLLKEVDPDGVTITQVSGGGSELVLKFTVLAGEYIGNIMEYCLYLGGGDASDDSQFEFDSINHPSVFERTRLSRENAIPIARKTRNAPIEKTYDFAFRAIWRIRT